MRIRCIIMSTIKQNKYSAKNVLNKTYVQQKNITQSKMQLKLAIASKSIYEFSEEEKRYYIKCNPEKFSYSDEELVGCDFVTTSVYAELVLTDYFEKKEPLTNETNYLFNFYSAMADEVLDD